MGTDVFFFVTAFLLPVAAWSGWYYGRREPVSTANALRDHKLQIATDYFKGLNYLLHDRPDKAIEIFVKVLEVETDTIETHLALGNLFRRRGEVDRAIRIHQNLVARTTLDVNQRGQALLELGLDYMRSGLFDRAESLLLELLDLGMYQAPALRHLVDIYQQERDWDKALAFCTRLEAVNGENLSVERAHFLCELAQERLDRGFRAEALELLERALSADRRCARASLMMAAVAIGNREYERAVQILKRVEHQDIDMVNEAIAPLTRCYRELDRMHDLHDYLDRLAALRTSTSPMLAVARLVEEQQGIDAAKHYVVQELKIRPTLRGIERLIDYSLQGVQGEPREDLLILKETAVRLIATKATYKCAQCGFSGRSLHWQCPSCKSWNKIKPIHGIEGE
ncbi:MAG: lipopolysaccharide assembly protein LapB [Gammaproteobacteria bacterium]